MAVGGNESLRFGLGVGTIQQEMLQVGLHNVLGVSRPKSGTKIVWSEQAPLLFSRLFLTIP